MVSTQKNMRQLIIQRFTIFNSIKHFEIIPKHEIFDRFLSDFDVVKVNHILTLLLGLAKPLTAARHPKMDPN